VTRVDYEAAWDELQERILERDGWGTRTLVTEMAHLRVKHKIPPEVEPPEAAVDPSVPALVPASAKIQEDRDDHASRGRQLAEVRH
jgi:hypothetical protein